MVLAENGETSFGFQMQGANLSDIESAYLVTETASVTKNQKIMLIKQITIRFVLMQQELRLIRR